MSQDTRKDPRAKIVSLNVRYKSATVDEFIDNHSHDVSKGGLFIKTSSPFPPGTLLKFEIRIAGDKAVIAGVGRVVWKREASQAGPEQPAGMGVKFIKIDDASRTVIDKLIASRGEGEGRNAYDDGVGDGGGGAHAPGQVPHTPAAAAARAPARPTPMGGTGMGPEATPFRPAPSASKIPVSAGKATMMGIGGIQEAIAGQKTGADAERTVARSPAAGRPASDDNERTLSTDNERTVARPSTAERLASEEKPKPAAAARLAGPAPASAAPTTAPMFPKSDSKAGMPPKNEQTVMKQAAELLEEALLGAGGSMEEIGQNPLFDVAKDTKDAKDDSNTALDALMKSSSTDDGQSTVQGVGPVDLHALMKPAGEAAAKPPVEPAASAAKATPAKAASAEPAPTLASALRVPSEVDSTLRSAGDEDAGAAPKAKGDSRPPKASPKATPSTRPAASAFVADAPEANNKALLWVVGAAAAGVLGYLFYSQISEPSDSDKLVPETPTTVSAPPTALPPEPTASASAAPAESASAAASASAAPAASASTSPAASGSAAAPASASATPPTPPPTPTQAVVAPVVQPRPQPPPRPKPTPPPPATDTETPPAPTEAAPTPRPAPPPPPAPKPKPKPKPEDDNPY